RCGPWLSLCITSALHWTPGRRPVSISKLAGRAPVRANVGRKTVSELPDSVHDEIKRLCAMGDKHAEARAFSNALTNYWEAWDLLPEPKTDWEAATWILVAIGDANFLGADYDAGRDNLSNSMR